MGKKGQKYNKYTIEFINEVLKEREKNGINSTSQKFQIPSGTIKTWKHKYKNHETIVKQKKGFGKKDEKNYKERYEVLKKVHWLLGKPRRFKVMFIRENLKNYKLSLMLDVLALKRSYWDKYKNFVFDEKDKICLQEIKKVFDENLKQFGYREIDKALDEKA
ncbi:hypothetical protein MCORR_v1c01880 [Mesoplasma corruscae]|uniref:Transposase n=2 Tax=Mesoplasma corruscae TaxID=216874 RepID=A0A2S5RGY8_9MOLU|nr:hypothetical protein MCORR_v1c01880 [Mesoplasma corruscae]